MAFDIIGDIHGHAAKLEALLRALGYRQTGHGWSHPGRQAVFVGDFIDRGPEQVRTVDIVRSMVESGSALAVMGNHELNAIAWHTPDPDVPGEFCRPHSSPKWGNKNRQQHARFLEEVEHLPQLHRSIIDWFQTLPLWLDLPGIRVVHACWHPRLMDWLAPQLPGPGILGPALLPLATREPDDDAGTDSPAPTVFQAVEALTKGIELPLPDGLMFMDRYGIERRRVRARWWDAAAVTYASIAMLPEEDRPALPDMAIPDGARIAVPTDKPLFFGHYWLTGTPAVLSPTVACVDYSAGKDGPLVAYRWDGEAQLDSARFVQAW